MLLSTLSLLLLSPPASAACLRGICTGDVVIEAYNNRWARVVAINSSSQNYALESRRGDKLGNWAFADLAVTKAGSCLGPICVGMPVIENYNNREAKVAGIKADGSSYALASRLDANALLGNWAPADVSIAVPGACIGGYCVGDIVEETYNSRTGMVAGVHARCVSLASGLQNANQMGCWGRNDLALRQRGKDVAEKQRREKEEKEAVELAEQGLIELPVYRAARKAGKSHKEAVEAAMGPVFLSLELSEKFLSRLAGHVYQFDKLYLEGAAKLLEPGEQLARRQLFALAALLPYLRAFGYSQLKERFVGPSLAKIEAALAAKGVRSLKDIESNPTTRRMTIFLLAGSLQSALPQLAEPQKPKAQELLALLGEIAAKSTSFGFRDLEPLLRRLPDYRALLREISQNLYFTGRAAGDLALLEFLENS